MIRSVLLSLDGVMTNSDLVNLMMLKTFFEKYSVPFSGKIYNEQFAGKRFIIRLKQYLEELQSAHLADMMAEAITLQYACAQSWQILPDAKAFLLSVKPTCQIGLLSTAPASLTDEVLKRLGLHWSFQHIIAAEQFTADRPAPEVYDRMRVALGARLEETLAVEAYPSGVIAAQAAHLHTVGVSRLFQQSDFPNDAPVVRTMTDIVLTAFA